MQGQSIQDEVGLILGTSKHRNPTPTAGKMQGSFQHGLWYDGEKDTGNEKARICRVPDATEDAGIREREASATNDSTCDLSVGARRAAVLGPSYKERETALDEMEVSDQLKQDTAAERVKMEVRYKRQRQEKTSTLDDRTASAVHVVKVKLAS
jgi:hypothetical protein